MPLLMAKSKCTSIMTTLPTSTTQDLDYGKQAFDHLSLPICMYVPFKSSTSDSFNKRGFSFVGS